MDELLQLWLYVHVITYAHLNSNGGLASVCIWINSYTT